MTDIPRPRTDASGEPAPEPIRFYGTTWVDHSGGYAARRAGLVLAALALAALGAFVLRLAYLGFAAGETGDTVNMLLVVAFAVCSSVGFTRTLNRYRRRPDGTEDEARERSMRSILVVGFLGVLLAYAARTLVEAPGERLRREDYEEELARHRKRSRRGKAARRKRTR